MYKVVRKQIRPNIQIAFYGFNRSTTLSAATLQLREQKYVQTGKIVSVDRIISEDQLTMTTTVYFRNKADKEEYQSDPELADMRQEQTEYFSNKGIVVELVSESEEV